MLYYSEIGTDLLSLWPDDYPWPQPPEGWILMEGAPPERPERYGAFIAQPDGKWLWFHYPDPPFGIFYTNDGKVKQYQYNETYVDLEPSATPLLAPKTWVSDAIDAVTPETIGAATSVDLIALQATVAALTLRVEALETA